MELCLLIPYISTLVAFMTAFTGIILEVLALSDSVTLRERRQRIVWIFYFSALFVVWIYFFLHIGVPYSAAFTGTPYVMAILSVPILLCHAVFLNTTGSYRGFSLLNYLIPIVYFLFYAIWTPMVPEEVRNGLIQSGSVFRFRIIPGYGAYCIFVVSIAVMRGIFSAIYGTIAIFIVVQRYRFWPGTKKPSRWAAFYFLIILLPLVNGVLTAIAPFGDKAGMVILSVTSFLIIIQMIVIISFSFDRYSLLFSLPLPDKESEHGLADPENANRETVKKVGRQKIPLTRERFENYYIRPKRYLDPNVRLTDLLQPLGTNRTTLSGFINTTYGMSFSRLTAHFRLREMERLMSIPENKNSTIASLVIQAGFASEGAYYLARRNEKEAMNRNKLNLNGKKG